MGLLKSIFSGKPSNPEEAKRKTNQKNFEIFKYDGMRAQRMGRVDYAIKCFVGALNLQEDFETMGYLSQIYIQTNALEEAHQLLDRMIKMEPQHTSTFLTLANVCYLQENYHAMAEAAQKAIALEEGNAIAHYMLGRATGGQNDNLMCVAHLTKAIVLKDDFLEARLLRAEALIKMKQYNDATEDIDAILAQDADDESALLLRAKIKEATGKTDEAEADYSNIIELNPFCEQAYLQLGQLYIAKGQLDEAKGLLDGAKGLLEEAKGLLGKAIALFDEAIEVNPNFAQAYHERGRAKLLCGDKEGSAEDMKKSLELKPEEAEKLNGKFGNQPEGASTNILGL